MCVLWKSQKRNGVQGLIEIENPNRVSQKSKKAAEVDVEAPRELTRRERYFYTSGVSAWECCCCCVLINFRLLMNVLVAGRRLRSRKLKNAIWSCIWKERQIRPERTLPDWLLLKNREKMQRRRGKSWGKVSLTRCVTLVYMLYTKSIPIQNL